MRRLPHVAYIFVVRTIASEKRVFASRASGLPKHDLRTDACKFVMPEPAGCDFQYRLMKRDAVESV